MRRFWALALRRGCGSARGTVRGPDGTSRAHRTVSPFKAGNEWLMRRSLPGRLAAQVVVRAVYRALQPLENGYIESFNTRLRDELLDGEIFYSPAGADRH